MISENFQKNMQVYCFDIFRMTTKIMTPEKVTIDGVFAEHGSAPSFDVSTMLPALSFDV